MKLKVPTTQYIFPPRAETCIPKGDAGLFLDMGWKPQLKYNDSHALIKILPGTTRNIELWNRHGERFRTYTTPDWLLDQLEQVAQALGLTSENWHLLDGGLLDQKHKAIKDTIVIWDILVQESEQLLGTTYQERYNKLLGAIQTEETYWYTHPKHEPIDFGIKLTDNIILARQYNAEDWDTLWNTVHTINAPYTTKDDIKPILEGVVLKLGEGKLAMGFKERNNTDWMVKCRIKTGRHRF